MGVWSAEGPVALHSSGCRKNDHALRAILPSVRRLLLAVASKTGANSHVLLNVKMSHFDISMWGCSLERVSFTAWAESRRSKRFHSYFSSLGPGKSTILKQTIPHFIVKLIDIDSQRIIYRNSRRILYRI